MGRTMDTSIAGEKKSGSRHEKSNRYKKPINIVKDSLLHSQKLHARTTDCNINFTFRLESTVEYILYYIRLLLCQIPDSTTVFAEPDNMSGNVNRMKQKIDKRKKTIEEIESVSQITSSFSRIRGNKSHISIDNESKEAVAKRCSVKKVFLQIS